MATTTFRKIARVAVGVAVAGMVLGQTGTAFASEDGAVAATPAASAGSWDTATAVLTDNQGKQTTVKALSFHYCSNVVGDDITLSDSQTVLFEKMQRFDVVHADPALTNGKADLAVTLLDGQQLTGTVSADCDFSGDNAAGRFNLYPDKLRSVEFRRGAAAGPTSTGSGGASTGQTAQPLRLTGSVAGTVKTTDVTCDRLAGSSWSWTAKGSVDGAPVEITFNTNHYRGAAGYATTGVTDEAGGLATLTSGEVQVASNGDTRGTFTVADDQRSGSIDADLENSAFGQQVHVSGSWRCS